VQQLATGVTVLDIDGDPTEAESGLHRGKHLRQFERVITLHARGDALLVGQHSSKQLLSALSLLQTLSDAVEDGRHTPTSQLLHLSPCRQLADDAPEATPEQDQQRDW
jgi:hypothetical protein